MDPSVAGRSLKIEDVIKKYAGKSTKKKDKKLTSLPAAAESSSITDSSYSMTTSDLVASTKLKNQLIN